MTSDEPDEDADNLEDDKLLEGLLGDPQPATPQSVIPYACAPGPENWPCRHGANEMLTVDADILAWFRTNHENWLRQISSVLRAWIATRPGTASDQQQGA